MLIEFSVANYRSFRDEVTFSMVASPLKTNRDELDERNLFVAPGDINLLRSAAIYGANASGKSNLISAIEFMRRFVITSSNFVDETRGLDVEPFRLSTETDSEPTSFEIVFVSGNRHYRYGFEVTKERVEAEWLYVTPKVRESKLFERARDVIELHGKFKSEGRDLEDRTRPNALFLTVAAQFNGKIAQQILGWFRSLEVTTGLFPNDEIMRTFTERQFGREESAANIRELICQLDLGIEDIQIEKRHMDSLLELPQIPDDAPEQITEVIKALESVVNVLGGVDEFRETVPGVVRTVHRKMSGKGDPIATELFDLDKDESEGTKKLFALSGFLVNALENGNVLVVDELDARLHPLLTQEIVKLFNDQEKNSNCAQLIFTIQNTNLLDHQLLRRDQIWFTEKDRLQASHLYSLVEFKMKNDARFERDYIQGRYGAIPFLGNIRQVFLEDN